MQCVNCKHLKHIQKPIRFGKDIFDTGMVECTKYDLVLEYTSTRALNKRTCVADEPQTDCTGSPIGDYRDGVGAWRTDCEDRYAIKTDSGDVVVYACPLGCEQTDCPWK